MKEEGDKKDKKKKDKKDKKKKDKKKKDKKNKKDKKDKKDKKVGKKKVCDCEDCANGKLMRKKREYIKTLGKNLNKLKKNAKRQNKVHIKRFHH